MHDSAHIKQAWYSVHIVAMNTCSPAPWENMWGRQQQQQQLLDSVDNPSAWSSYLYFATSIKANIKRISQRIAHSSFRGTASGNKITFLWTLFIFSRGLSVFWILLLIPFIIAWTIKRAWASRLAAWLGSQWLSLHMHKQICRGACG